LLSIVRGLQRDFSDLCGGLPASAGLLQVVEALEAQVFGAADLEAVRRRAQAPLRPRALALSDVLNGNGAEAVEAVD